MPALLIQMLKKIMQNQAHIFLWICCGSFRIHLLLAMYDSSLSRLLLVAFNQRTWFLPLSDRCKILSCLPVIFHWIFHNYSCTHIDRQLCATSYKICSWIRHRICKCCNLIIGTLMSWMSCIQDQIYVFHICLCGVLWQDYSELDINVTLFKTLN